MVAVEVEYLTAQLWQLPIMQQALEQSEASGHTCQGDHCGGGHADEERPGGGPGFSDSDEQQQLALMLSSIT